ncbi:hypothetical protein PZA18_14730 [Chitinimonas sp. DQS-5]|uniref:Uncharacterized protein n=1 Tax=Parachitinimonas caeni TaxID=3031301 RepID=A0ABT7DZ87_9NEIS|nr:hypothetical protein [Parachitinimonas caeni]
MRKDGTLVPENPDALSVSEKKVIRDLNEGEKRYLRKACKEVFHNNAPALPKLRGKYLGVLGTITSLISIVRACDADINHQIQEGVCEDE